MAEDTRDPVRDQRHLAAETMRKSLEAANRDEARALEDAEMVRLTFRQMVAMQGLPGYDVAADGTALDLLAVRLEEDHYRAAFYREEAGLLSRFLAVIEQLHAEGE